MIYPENFEEKLGFTKIRSLLRGATLCPLGARRVDELTFMTDRRQLERELSLLSEMQQLMTLAQQPLPTADYYDLTPALHRIRLVGTFLEVEELFDLQRSLRTIDALRRYLCPAEGQEVRLAESTGGGSGASFAERFAGLRALAVDVVTPEPLLRKLDQTLTPTGELRDNASPRLAEVRHEIARTVGSIGRLLNNILRGAQADGWVEAGVTPTLRDGRLVIPIPPSSKRKVPGIVHDESASGRTLYVEPSEVVEANNRIRELEAEERQEVIRILQEIASEIRPEVENLLAGYDLLGAVDFLQAKVRLARQLDGIVPTLSPDNVTDWVLARHPLLYLRYQREGKTVVPLDILLDHKRQRIVLISGPNAGGKSVCLETLGLVQYMIQHALPVPMKDNSRCAVYKDILVDIGDQQSIDNDLSTYSSHLQNMKTFLRHAGGQTLVLIDEFGSGTEPQIGGAIAQALLGKLNKQQAKGVITTHFTNLKLFADQTPGIVNGAMLYDRGEMRPLFRLEVGRPGSSFALEIAHKIGLPQDVIEEAKQIVGSDYVNMDKYLQDISRDKRYWEQKRQKVHQQEKALEQKSQEYDQKTSELKQRRQEVMQQARDAASSLLSEANARIERTIREIKEAKAEKEATRRIRQEHEKFKSRLTPKPAALAPEPKNETLPTPEGGELKVGSYVRLRGQQTVGQILAINGRQCQVAFGMLKSNVDMSRLEPAHRPKDTGTTLSNRNGTGSQDVLSERRLNFHSELDVRGMRAEEALLVVMRFLDDASLVSASQVRILHGTGTGALRQAIRQYLGTVPHVAAYHDEHVQFGGAGITVVELE